MFPEQCVTVWRERLLLQLLQSGLCSSSMLVLHGGSSNSSKSICLAVKVCDCVLKLSTLPSLSMILIVCRGKRFSKCFE